MRAFFKGWRRKSGCILLVMAAALFIGRVRSETYSDSFNFALGKSVLACIGSENGYLLFESTDISGLVAQQPYFTTLFCPDPHLCYLFYRDNSIGWRFQCIAFGKFEFQTTEGQPLVRARRTWFISYWTAIAPLTLLAAYLILWPGKHRSGSHDVASVEPCAEMPAIRDEEVLLRR